MSTSQTQSVLKKPIRAIVTKDGNNYQRVLDRLHDIVNGGLSLGNFAGQKGNLDLVIINVPSTGPANTDFAVVHNLGRIPTGYISTYQSDFGIFVVGVTTWTTTTMYLKCSVANMATHLLIF